MSSEPKPPEGTTVCAYHAWYSTQQQCPICYPVAAEAGCPHCAAKDQEIERLKAEHAVAIQQARREVLELACKAVCEWCAPESGLCPAVDVGGEEWGHPVPASEDIDPCNASDIRAAFATKWKEETK